MSDPNYYDEDDDVIDLGELSDADIAAVLDARNAQNADRQRSQLHASQGNAAGAAYRAEDLGEDPYVAAHKMADRVVNEGGSQLDGLAAGISTIMRAAEAGDPRTLAQNAKPSRRG